MRLSIRVVALGLIFLPGVVWLPAVLNGCASSHRGSDAGGQPFGDRVTGMVTSRVRTILPPDALLRVELADISRPDAPPRTVNLKEFWTDGRQFPLPFDVPYSAAAIDSDRSYAILVRISQGNRTIFTNSTGQKVITNGLRSGVEVVVEPVTGPGGGPR